MNSPRQRRRQTLGDLVVAAYDACQPRQARAVLRLALKARLITLCEHHHRNSSRRRDVATPGAPA